jgi:hypothetical protein
MRIRLWNFDESAVKQDEKSPVNVFARSLWNN